MTAPTQPGLPCPADVEELEELLSRPPERLIESIQGLDGDILFLGVGGKMGPTIARMAHRALQLNGSPHRVIGVSRFSDPRVRERLEQMGIQTVAADLLDTDQVEGLPDAPYVVSMSGFKFGVREHPELAWAANCYLPALLCRRYASSRIVAFSTGNVYRWTSPASGGSVETDRPAPIGEYAMTALGRERMYEYFSQLQQTQIVLLRLNYATELRYGVLVDLAQQVMAGEPIDVSMSYVNVIWLADANAMALGAFTHAASPVNIINLAGPEILSTRQTCRQLARELGTRSAVCRDRTRGRVAQQWTTGPPTARRSRHAGRSDDSLDRHVAGPRRPGLEQTNPLPNAVRTVLTMVPGPSHVLWHATLVSELM